MSPVRVAVLGGGSCFAQNLCYWLTGGATDVLSISRSPLRPAPFTYGLNWKPFSKGYPLNSYPKGPPFYEQAHLVTELPRIMALLDDFEPHCIVNFAALCEVGLSWDHALDYYETNLMSLVRLTNELAKRSWFKKFVQIGSSEVYGSVSKPASEEHKINPSSPYAASKAVFDSHLRAISSHQSFPAVIVMPSNGYCEGQTINRIIPKAIICAIKGTKLALQGGGVARKSYLHADDISSAIITVMEKGALGETYNCGPLWSTEIRYVVDLVAKMYGKRLEDIADIAPERTGQDSQYLLNSNKIKTLGWKPTIDLKTGLQRMKAWVESHPELLDMDTTYTHRS